MAHNTTNEKNYPQPLGTFDMKVLILGAAGMLGQALVQESQKRQHLTLAADLHKTPLNFDITNDNELTNIIKKNTPDIVINTIAIVSHDNCEKNPGLAYQVNARPASIIAHLAKQLDFYFVHISTDHFYTKDKNMKHVETSRIYLLNEYARTKYIAECFAKLTTNSLIVRTNIVGFRNDPTRKTFVEWALEMLKSKQPITLFNDYYVSSIDVQTFSKVLFDTIDHRYQGTINIASQEVFTKQTFIETLAAKFKYNISRASIGSIHMLPGKRAESCGLDSSKVENLLNYKLPNLDQIIQNLVNEYQEKKYEL